MRKGITSGNVKRMPHRNEPVGCSGESLYLGSGEKTECF